MKRIIAGILLLGIVSVAMASNLDEVRKAIKKEKAKWTAGDTPVSGLSDWEQQRLLGAIIVGDFHATTAPSTKVTGRIKTPSRLDWRDKDGQNWVTPIKNQGSCGSCWAFGSVAQLESVVMISAGVADPDLDLSEQYIVSCDSINYGCDGGYMYPAYDFLRDTGTPDEECYRYLARDAYNGAPCGDACPNPALRRIASWSPVAYGVDSLKAAVCEHPITVTFWVHQDFFYYTGGIYKYTWGKMVGGHATCVVGWDNRGFICKNSWGPEWGEGGYFRIAFNQMSLKYPVRFGLGAGSFHMALSAPPRFDTVITLWGNIKENGDDTSK